MLRKIVHIIMGIVSLSVVVFLILPQRSTFDPTRVKPSLIEKVTFRNVTESAGIRFHHHNGATGQKLLPETMGGSVGVIDFDRDGWPDLFFVDSGGWPGSNVPAKHALYRNLGDGTFEDVTRAMGLEVSCYGMGVAVGDFDNDGWPDLFISAVGGDHLLRNLQGSRFEEVTRRAGVAGPGGWSVVSNQPFEKIKTSIAFPASAAWLDYDGDGHLDLFVCRYLTWSPALDLGIQAVLPNGVRAYVPPNQFPGVNNTLYRNNGDGTFTDVSEAAGIAVWDVAIPGQAKQAVGKALGVVVCDVNEDGWPDLVIANDTVRNFLYLNVRGTEGQRMFQESALMANLAYVDGRPRGGMGIDAGYLHPDMFNIVIANFTNEPNTLFSRTRRQPVGFHDMALSTGLAGKTRAAMKFGALFADWNHDGHLDLLTTNGHLEPDIATAQPGQTHAQASQLFWNTGDPGRLFVEADPEDTGFDLFRPIVGRGCAYVDYDRDGFLDLVVCENNGPARLFRNQGNSHNWIRFVLDPGRSANRDAIGAEVTVISQGVAQKRYLSTARGYLSHSEHALTFGLGSATAADRVDIRWPAPNSQNQQWQSLEANATYRLTWNQEAASVIELLATDEMK